MALESSSLARQFRLRRRQQKSAFNFAIFHESSLRASSPMHSARFYGARRCGRSNRLFGQIVAKNVNYLVIFQQ
jgi:hypothetical protein